MGRIASALVCAVVAALAVSTTAVAQDSGPALSVSPSALRQSLSCEGNLARGATPVLLLPGTTLQPKDEYSWSYERAFRQTGRSFCALTLPNNAMSDIQVSAEYVVGAIRSMAKTAGRKISIIGHSQGGMISRWSLKFWPDTRNKVDDFIGLAPSNHGTVLARGLCLVGGCAPAIWQQRDDSEFMRALNTGPETYPGIDYTVAYTNFDEVVFPNLDLPHNVLPDAAPPASSRLDGASNISLQSVCALHPADHLTIGTSDAVAYAIAVDALDHPGPARAARIPRSACLALLHKGVDPLAFPTNFAHVGLVAGQQVLLYPHVAAEPALKPYARQASSSQ